MKIVTLFDIHNLHDWKNNRIYIILIPIPKHWKTKNLDGNEKVQQIKPC